MLTSSKEAYESFPLKDKLSYKEFDEIIKATLRASRDLVIEGQTIKTPIGNFRISKRKNKFFRPKVNIGASKKYKQEIIDRGGTPYESIRDGAGEIIGNNGGEDWLVYFTEDYYYYLTVGNERSLYYGSNVYRFKPASSTVRLRRAKMSKDKLIHLKYAES